MEKPREWWLDIILPNADGRCGDIYSYLKFEDLIHVIEKSAYDAVVKERDDLEEKLKIARDALIKIEPNCDRIDIFNKTEYQQKMHFSGHALEYEQIAKEALAKLGGEG